MENEKDSIVFCFLSVLVGSCSKKGGTQSESNDVSLKREVQVHQDGKSGNAPAESGAESNPSSHTSLKPSVPVVTKDDKFTLKKNYVITCTSLEDQPGGQKKLTFNVFNESKQKVAIVTIITTTFDDIFNQATQNIGTVDGEEFGIYMGLGGGVLISLKAAIFLKTFHLAIL
jgi:hypothetical protein